jgi:hypothetical protein
MESYSRLILSTHLRNVQDLRFLNRLEHVVGSPASQGFLCLTKIAVAANDVIFVGKLRFLTVSIKARPSIRGILISVGD